MYKRLLNTEHYAELPPLSGAYDKKQLRSISSHTEVMLGSRVPIEYSPQSIAVAASVEIVADRQMPTDAETKNLQ